MCAATPRLTAFVGSSCGPLVNARHSGFEHRCPTRSASAFLTRSEKSSLISVYTTLHQMDEPKSINFAVIGEPLNKLLIATGNKLSRQWPAKYYIVTGARELFVMSLRIAHLTYRSALYLGGDIPAD